MTIRSKLVKILTIFGTRPEVIKLHPVLAKLKQNNAFESIVVSTSQHREMIDDLLTLFKIEPDHDLNIIQENQSLVDISTRAMMGLSPLLQKEKPDMVLIQGDTTSAFIGTFTAFCHKIPIGHVEAGLRSFDKMHPYPEEINRRLISLIGDLHFAPTKENAQHLYDEGVNAKKVFVTGNTVIDSLLDVARRNHGALDQYLPPEVLDSRRMVLVTAHRRENWGEPLDQLCSALKDLVEAHPDITIVYPVHLNPNVRKTVFPKLGNVKGIFLLDPFPYEPFVEAMIKSHLIITDSGGIQEEGPSLKRPILVFRKVTERPEGLATGGVKLVGLDGKKLFEETSRLLEDSEAYQNMIADHNPYGDGHAAERIVQAVLHYFGMADRPEDFKPGKGKA
jgi:UDP-N-acetylglucosamine 2-epimerase (non-hydrolysing)